MPNEPRAVRSALAVAAALVALASAAPVARAQAPADFVPVTDAMLRDPAPADWPMWRRTLDGWGCSPLDEVTRENVGDLRLAWTRGMGPGSRQATPLAYRGVLYVPNPRDVISNPHSSLE